MNYRLRARQSDEKALWSRHFIRIADGDQGPGRLYLQGTAPADAADDGQIWRLRRIDEQGMLLFSAGGAVVGSIPQGLPAFKLPRFDWSVVAELLTAAITIALIGFMEAIAIAKGMATRTRQRLDANQELLGQGLANVFGSLFQSYTVAGSFSRSAVNFDAGARTGFSSVITSLVVVVTLLWLTPLLYHLPQATLAAVIMMAVIGLVRVAPVRHVWQTHRHDGVVAMATFLLTLILAPHLDRGILIGVGLSLGLFLYRSMQPRIAVLSRYADGTFRDAEVHNLRTCDNITVLRFDGSLYFANTSYFEDKVLEKVARKPALKFVIIDAEGINQIDVTGEEMLLDLAQRLREVGIELLFARMKRQFMATLQRTGSLGRLGAEHFFPRVQNAVDAAVAKLETGHAAHCPLYVLAASHKAPSSSSGTAD